MTDPQPGLLLDQRGQGNDESPQSKRVRANYFSAEVQQSRRHRSVQGLEVLGLLPRYIRS